jgi:hypothetical protein
MRNFYFLFLVTVLFSCTKAEPEPANMRAACQTISKGNISGVNYIGMMDGARFDVICRFPNGCDYIYKVNEERKGQEVTISVTVANNTCSPCTESPTTQSMTYVFNPPAPGTYYLKWEGIANRTDTVKIR